MCFVCVCMRERECADSGGKWRRGWVGILASRVVVCSCDHLVGLFTCVSTANVMHEKSNMELCSWQRFDTYVNSQIIL